MGVGTVSMSFFRAHFFRVKSLALTFFFTKFEKSNITDSGIQVFCVSWGEGNRFENSWVKLQCVTETLGADWRQEVNFVSRGLRNRQRVLLYRKRIFYKGMHSRWILIDETHCEILSISQFQLRPRPLPRATAGHWPALSVPGVGHFQILCCPGDGHLPTPSFWHADDFTGKTRRLAHLSRTGKNWRGL